MVLADTSVWISHLREDNPGLVLLLREDRVLIHPYVIGELACGNLKNRGEILALLEALPKARVIEEEEYFYFLDRHHLAGKGLGFVDVHLLASCALEKCGLMTLDRALRTAADDLGLGAKE